MIRRYLGGFLLFSSLACVSPAPSNPTPRQFTDEEHEAVRIAKQKADADLAAAERERYRAKIEIIKDGDVPTAVKISAADGFELTWISISLGINSVSGSARGGAVMIDPASLKRMLFTPGIKEPPSVNVNITYWSQHSYEKPGWIDPESHDFDELYRYWIREAENESALKTELTSGQCAQNRYETMTSSIEKAKSAMDASGKFELKSSQIIVAKPGGVSVSMTIGARPNEEVSLCLFGFSDVNLRVKQPPPKGSSPSKAQAWEESKPSDVGLILNLVSAVSSSCQLTNARGDVEALANGTGCSAVLVVQHKL